MREEMQPKSSRICPSALGLLSMISCLMMLIFKLLTFLSPFMLSFSNRLEIPCFEMKLNAPGIDRRRREDVKDRAGHAYQDAAAQQVLQTTFASWTMSETLTSKSPFARLKHGDFPDVNHYAAHLVPHSKRRTWTLSLSIAKAEAAAAVGMCSSQAGSHADASSELVGSWRS